MNRKRRFIFTSTVALVIWCLAPQAGAQDCACVDDGCGNCQGLDQTPDFKNQLSGTEKDSVTEDELNGPWIKRLLRVPQCVGGFRGTLPAIDDDPLRDSATESRHLSISGPSLIRVPEEHVASSACAADDPNATTCYYLYFAHHAGQWIRMAYAPNLSGPWVQYEPGPPQANGTGGGVLTRESLLPENNGHTNYSEYAFGHIASPNVQVRWDLSGNPSLHPTIRDKPDPFYVMYFHAEIRADTGDQLTWVAVSSNGTQFYHYSPENIGRAYASVAQIFPGNDLDESWVAIARRKNNNASIVITPPAPGANNAGLSDDDWTEPGCAYSVPKCDGNGANQLHDPLGAGESKIHHVGITARGRYLYVFYHRKDYDKDRPMHIRVARIDMRDPQADWDFQITSNGPLTNRRSYPVLVPITSYERVHEGTCDERGKGGPPDGNGCDVRDPFVFNDTTGRSYLVYAYAWEQGIGIAEIEWTDELEQQNPDSVPFGNGSTALARCKDIEVSLDSNGHASITRDDVNDGSSVCTVDSAYISLIGQSEFTCDDVGEHTVELKATDFDGGGSEVGSTICQALVTVVEIDSDDDGVGDCTDLCPTDSNKIAPGECGCGVADTNTDGDNTADCNDGCPEDAGKTAPGACGCGTPDTDGDGDGVADCIDRCPGADDTLGFGLGDAIGAWRFDEGSGGGGLRCIRCPRRVDPWGGVRRRPVFNRAGVFGA